MNCDGENVADLAIGIRHTLTQAFACLDLGSDPVVRTDGYRENGSSDIERELDTVPVYSDREVAAVGQTYLVRTQAGSADCDTRLRPQIE